MEITITNDELLSLSKTLNKLAASNIGSVRFKYAVLRNIKFIKDDVDTLNETKKPSDSFTKHQQDIYDLATKYCEKDDKGNIALYTDNTFSQLIDPTIHLTGVPKVIENSDDEYKKAIKELETKNKSVIVAHNKKLNAFNKLLNKDVTLNIYHIDVDLLEEVGDIDFNDLINLSHIVKEQ